MNRLARKKLTARMSHLSSLNIRLSATIAGFKNELAYIRDDDMRRDQIKLITESESLLAKCRAEMADIRKQLQDSQE